MIDLEAWVYSWDVGANAAMADLLRERCGVLKLSRLHMKDHEPVVLNYVLDHSDAPFVLIMHSGIQVLHDDFVRVMYDFMVETPSAGIISPNREGEPRCLGLMPKRWWFDGIAGLFRRPGPRFDEDFIFSQWNDLDIGLEYEHQGYTVWRDQRVSVAYRLRDFGSRSAFYHAYAARNKLLLDIKHFKVGLDWWHGAWEYNNHVPAEVQIPTQFDLVCYGAHELEMFADSVESELHWILEGGVKENPNLTWQNPVLLERSK